MQTIENWIIYLWDNHRTWFLILLPILFIPMAIIALMAGNVEKGKEEVKKAEEEDRDLLIKQTASDARSDELKKQADNIEKEIQEVRKDTTDLDWYKH